jgi:hypothetical protein
MFDASHLVMQKELEMTLNIAAAATASVKHHSSAPRSLSSDSTCQDMLDRDIETARVDQSAGLVQLL